MLDKPCSPVDIKNRDISHKDADIAAVKALAQAAVNVELFTMPLYMTSMYSIQGMHQITGKNSLYQGRLWPGSAPVANPQNANEQCFNTIFSVFIQEMLHLQIASNIASALGQSPTFTSPLLQNDRHGWICYGAGKTVIPHIVDLQDTKNYKDVTVNLSELNENAVKLFLAIEEPIDVAKQELYLDEECSKTKYFPPVPFKDWNKDYTEENLPMFGSIGWMYECLVCYLNIEYTNGQSLFELVFDPTSVQQDMFNNVGNGHQPEYPKMPTTVTMPKTVSKETLQVAKDQICKMVSAITDQGEGSTLKTKNIGSGNVEQDYQPDFKALKANNPTYSDTGCPVTSSRAYARYFGGVVDHYDRFQQVRGFLNSGEVITWKDWHQAGYTWSPDLLKTCDYLDNPSLPSLKEVADALNELKRENGINCSNYKLLSQAATGAIAGVTTVLNSYWEKPTEGKNTVTFPYPSMIGSGDRISICWAIFGEAPDLSMGVQKRMRDTLYHACQGLNFEHPEQNNCASQEIFHTCRGSNTCKGEGGCGFVQSISGGGSCGSPAQKNAAASPFYSAPGDNRCHSFGGCAVPISASQLFPKSGKMALYKLTGKNPEPIQDDAQSAVTLNFTEQSHTVSCKKQPVMIDFKEGDAVHDIAWKAYTKVLESQGEKPPEKPKPSALRLAFPPST